MHIRILAAVALAALAAPAAAAAHVTLQPKEVSAGQFTRLDVRVPNERDTKGTVEVQVQFPPGFAAASYEPVAGWKAVVKRRKAATPIDLHGEKVTEEIDTVTWTGDGKDGLVAPGSFQDFGLSVRIPDAAGDLTFKAIQTYEGGEVVRWIGPADADEPAAIVKASAAAGGGGHTAAADRSEEPAAAAEDDDDGDGAPAAVAWIALALGAAGLLLGGISWRRAVRYPT